MQRRASSIAGSTVACATLAACVTINIYFPAAAAERVADRIIDEVWQLNPDAAKPPVLAENPAPPAATAVKNEHQDEGHDAPRISLADAKKAYDTGATVIDLSISPAAASSGRAYATGLEQYCLRLNRLRWERATPMARHALWTAGPGLSGAEGSRPAHERAGGSRSKRA